MNREIYFGMELYSKELPLGMLNRGNDIFRVTLKSGAGLVTLTP